MIKFSKDNFFFFNSIPAETEACNQSLWKSQRGADKEGQYCLLLGCRGVTGLQWAAGQQRPIAQAADTAGVVCVS